MIKKYLSIGTPYDSFNNDKILSHEVSTLYPGAMWVYELKKLLQDSEFKIHTSDVIHRLIQKKTVNPCDVYLYCDETYLESSSHLIRLGCNPLILSSFESPIVSRKFYLKLEEAKNAFKYKILFKGAIDSRRDENCDILHFPSFSRKDLDDNYPEGRDDRFVLVMSNKYYEDFQSPTRLILRRLKNSIPIFDNRFTRSMRSIQLYDKRLEIISYLSNINRLDLYGNGWNNINNLPDKFKKRLLEVDSIKNFKNLLPGTSQKVALLSKFKYSLCLENCQYPGYITEKIIDALISKTLPIYLGAPDIFEFIPKNCFINVDDFKTLPALFEYVKSLSDEQYNDMIASGQKFLRSERGYKFSYESFADEVKNRLLNGKS